MSRLNGWGVRMTLRVDGKKEGPAGESRHGLQREAAEHTGGFEEKAADDEADALAVVLGREQPEGDVQLHSV